MNGVIVSLRKIISSAGFWFCVLMTVVLMFAAQVYVDPDARDRYSVFRIITDIPREKYTEHFELCDTQIISNARSGLFTMFSPIIAAFCFVPRICAERQSGAVRYQIFRGSKISYYLTQYLTGIISGGLAVSLGFAIFSAAALLLFPSADKFDGFDAQMLSEGFDYLKALFGVWLYGTFWSAPAMFFTSFMQNKYIVMCIPFFLKYGLSQIYSRIMQNAFSGIELDGSAIKFAEAINPESMLWQSGSLATVLVFGITAVIMTAGYLMINTRRSDQGGKQF